jgi:hypothetical protein
VFSTYFELGLRHIADLDAYDHMLFLLALICVYQLIDLKRVIILVTAFTVGHSLTLILSTLDILVVEAAYIEFLIPVTIFITAIWNLFNAGKGSRGSMGWKYFFALFFGLIHGMGFSNYLKMLLGKEHDLFVPLLGFNLGIEVGQIAIVILIMLFSLLTFQIFRFKHRDWILVISGACAGIALMLARNAVFW